MKMSLRIKLTLSYFALTSFTGIVIFLLISLTSDQRLKSLVDQEQQAEIIAEVINWYEIEGSWQGFEEYYINLHPLKLDNKVNLAGRNSTKKPLERPAKRRINQHGILDADKRVLKQFLTFSTGDTPPDVYLTKIKPIEIDGKVIAWLVPKDGKGISLQSEKKIFFEHTNQVLLIAVATALFVAAILGGILAKYLLRPIEALTKASQAMAKGDLKQSVVKTSRDELGELAESFNKMSAELALADIKRRQMTADIAHDLGTPLQVISGYIEMAQDLNYPLDSSKLDIISGEIGHIKRLLNDLSVLSEADEQTLSVICTEVNLVKLFSRIEGAFQAQCLSVGVSFKTSVEHGLFSVLLDEERMVQVLSNLVSNALRYSQVDGEIVLKVKREKAYLIIEVKDNGIGIEAKHLPFVFDRFYRVSHSRSSESGHMGLGLSITKALVELQNGVIKVDSAGIGKGCNFQMRFKMFNMGK